MQSVGGEFTLQNPEAKIEMGTLFGESKIHNSIFFRGRKKYFKEQTFD